MEVKKDRWLTLKKKSNYLNHLEGKRNKFHITKQLNRASFTTSREVNNLVQNSTDKHDANSTFGCDIDNYFEQKKT